MRRPGLVLLTIGVGASLGLGSCTTPGTDTTAEALLGPNAPFGGTNSIGMKFERIAPGEFIMGSPPDEAGGRPDALRGCGSKGCGCSRAPDSADRGSDETRHGVVLTKGFYLGATEVTQAQWKAVMPGNPSHYQGDSRPVDGVSWHDAVEFCQKLSRKEGRQYRLPTEAEWEYACRAGTTTPFNTGSTIGTDQANIGGHKPEDYRRPPSRRRQTVPVAGFEPNAWGLYDMHGNVWEWCSNWYGPYPERAVTDPAGPPKGQYRVLRGGCWGSCSWGCRSAFRGQSAPDCRPIHIRGLRVVLEVE